MDDLEVIYDKNDNPTHEEIFIHLSYMSALLKKFNIKHWVCYGTLLGSIREKSIIKHDYDFDLGILYEDHPRVLELNKEINSDGYSLEKGFGVVYRVPNIKESEYKWRSSIKISFRGQILGDIYIYYNCPDGFLRRYDPEEKIYYWPNSIFPYCFVEELEETEINGIFFPCPKLGVILVEHFYGPYWKTPIKALSQGGDNHPDYDFYGNFKYLQLENLIKFAEENFGVKLSPSEPEIDYMFPKEQLKWIEENEKYIIKIKKK